MTENKPSRDNFISAAKMSRLSEASIAEIIGTSQSAVSNWKLSKVKWPPKNRLIRENAYGFIRSHIIEPVSTEPKDQP